MALSDLTVGSVKLAISEYDELGRDRFLERYRFKKARGYYLLHDGKRYDSKAIAGAAHGHIGPGWKPLGWDEFSGGASTVKPTLEALGFTMAIDSNPDWSRDELILALELYLATKGRTQGQDSKAVIELSALLNRLAQRLGHDASQTYRNPNGVHMKLMNFRRVDPEASGGGLQRGNADEAVVWDLYAGDPGTLAAVSNAIRAAVASDGALVPFEGDDDDDYEAPEGRLLTRLHKTYERDRKVVTKRKAQALKAGNLRCEACSLDFGERYGEHGRGYIEAHHAKPVHTLGSAGKTRVSDLVLLCSNCHRMIHKRRPWLTVDELKNKLKNQ